MPLSVVNQECIARRASGITSPHVWIHDEVFRTSGLSASPSMFKDRTVGREPHLETLLAVDAAAFDEAQRAAHRTLRESDFTLADRPLVDLELRNSRLSQVISEAVTAQHRCGIRQRSHQ